MVEMHKLQLRHGCKFVFSTPQKDGKNYISWFLADVYEFSIKENASKEKEKRTKEVTNGKE